MVNADIDNKKPNISGLTKPNLSPNIKIEKAPGIPKRDPTSKAIPIWCSVRFDITPNLSIYENWAVLAASKTVKPIMANIAGTEIMTPKLVLFSFVLAGSL